MERNKKVMIGVMIYNIVMVLSDAFMTSYAFGHGYYETNVFTNSFGLVMHAFSLCFILIGVAFVWDIFYKNRYIDVCTWTIMSFIGVIWTVNNIISVLMLGGVV